MNKLSVSMASFLSLLAACTEPGLDEPQAIEVTQDLPAAGGAARQPKPMKALDLIAADASPIRSKAPGQFQAEVGEVTATFDADGVSFADRPFAVRLQAFGREGSVADAARPAAEVSDCLAEAPLPEMECERRVELRRGDVVEWWKPVSEGLEQGFDVATRPAGEGKLVFDLALGGAASVTPGAAHDEAGASIIDTAGRAWTVSDLHAWDADGAPLPMELAIDGTAVHLVVDDSAARYPIVVDPTYSWALAGTTSGMKLGFAVTGAGDLNGDGYEDVAVGAPYRDSDRGRVYILHGGSREPSLVKTIDGGSTGDHFGFSLTSFKVTGNPCCSALVVGAPYKDTGKYNNAGRVYVFQGVYGTTVSSTATYYLTDNNNGAEHFGYSIANAGDVNGDDHEDLVIGAPGFDYCPNLCYSSNGKFTIFKGSDSGTMTEWYNYRNTSSTSDYKTSELGATVAGVGDINGDGRDDVVAAMPNAMGDNGCIVVASFATTTLYTSAILCGTASNGKFGTSIASAGTYNGKSSFVVGVPYATVNGAANAGGIGWFGNWVWTGTPMNSMTYSSSTNWGDTANAYFGRGVAFLGDVNEDGRDDWAAASPGKSGGTFSVYSMSTTSTSYSAWASYSRGGSDDGFGQAMSVADTDGDGINELLVGAPYVDNDEGYLYSYSF